MDWKPLGKNCFRNICGPCSAHVALVLTKIKHRSPSRPHRDAPECGITFFTTFLRSTNRNFFSSCWLRLIGAKNRIQHRPTTRSRYWKVHRLSTLKYLVSGACGVSCLACLSSICETFFTFSKQQQNMLAKNSLQVCTSATRRMFLHEKKTLDLLGSANRSGISRLTELFVRIVLRSLIKLNDSLFGLRQ